MGILGARVKWVQKQWDKWTDMERLNQVVTSEVPEHSWWELAVFRCIHLGSRRKIMSSWNGTCLRPFGLVWQRWLGRLAPSPWFPVYSPESQEMHTHDWDLTACPEHSQELQILQVVQHMAWSKTHPHTATPGKQCSAGSCCKNFLDQCRYLQGFFLPSGTYGF